MEVQLFTLLEGRQFMIKLIAEFCQNHNGDFELLKKMVEAASEAGATHAGYTMLRLPHELKGLFESWLDANYPERAQKVLNGIRGIRGGALNTAEYDSRMHGSGPYAELIGKRFAAGVKRFGLNKTQRNLRTDLFERPEKSGHQMSLFAG